MRKAVLISIRSEWCCQIASGKKTVEIRRNRPSIEPPFQCYIYCTQATPLLAWQERWSFDHKAFRKEVWPVHKYGREKAESLLELFNGRVLGEFVCDDIRRIGPECGIIREDLESAIAGSCLSINQVKEYANWKAGAHYADSKDLYGWHISDLKIYDNPKSLLDFHRSVDETELWCKKCAIGGKKGTACAFCYGLDGLRVRRPPQSWCYVEELK